MIFEIDYTPIAGIELPVLRWERVSEFFIVGDPIGQPRPRGTAVPDGKGGYRSRSYNPSTADAWKRCVTFASSMAAPRDSFDGPARIDLHFFRKRPKYMLAASYPDGPIPHPRTYDLDNLVKSTLDAMESCGIFKNDSQDCCGDKSKWYTARGGRAGCAVRVSKLVGESQNTMEFDAQ